MKNRNISNVKDIEDFAPELKEFITKHKLFTTYEENGQIKKYALVDAWKFAGLSFGLTCIPEKPVRVKPATEIKYSCEAIVIDIKLGTKLSSGTGICSNLETTKKDSPEYVINSMAQTRAIAKAYRNLLGFLLHTAGFESTPAEEMDEVKKKPVPVKADKEKERILRFIDKAVTISELEILQPQITAGELIKIYNKRRKELTKVKNIKIKPLPTEVIGKW